MEQITQTLPPLDVMPARRWGRWSAEQDTILREAVEKERKRVGGGKLSTAFWRSLEAPLGRTADAIMTRAYTRLDKMSKSTARNLKLRPENEDDCVVMHPIERTCLRCRRPFTAFDRKRNWMCDGCKKDRVDYVRA